MNQTHFNLAPVDLRVVLGLADEKLAHDLALAAQPASGSVRFSICGNLVDLRSGLERDSHVVVVLDESILNGAALVETLLQLTEACPVIVVAAPWRQAELWRSIAEGDVEFVAKVGDFVSLAAAFIARRVRWAELAGTALGLPWRELPPDFASILRHEINNPLTGILGNAELLRTNLRGNLPPGALQRLETIVDLALRLRETTRRLSNAWDRDHAPARTA